uniref:hypothetical protein n=1 Tax=Hoyosella subflava TaxID=639313 RepID=UPI00059C720F|nr:hypothetical protein [Hoyosella subflava]
MPEQRLGRFDVRVGGQRKRRGSVMKIMRGAAREPGVTACPVASTSVRACRPDGELARVDGPGRRRACATRRGGTQTYREAFISVFVDRTDAIARAIREIWRAKRPSRA